MSAIAVASRRSSLSTETLNIHVVCHLSSVARNLLAGSTRMREPATGDTFILYTQGRPVRALCDA